MNIAEFLENSARKFPKRKVLIFNTRSFRYTEFNLRVNQYANLFKTCGIGKGAHVGILLNNCPEYIMSVFALFKIGAVVIPINRFLTTREISYIISDCGITCLISSVDFNEHFDQLLATCSSLKKVFLQNLTQESSIASGNQCVCLHDKVDTCSSEFTMEKTADTDVAVIIYTSGTTGYPKGAMLSHKNLCSNVLTCTGEISVVPSDNLLLILPMFHSFTFTVCILMPVASGACIIGLSSVKPFSRVLKAILFRRVTICIFIPKIYDMLSEKKIPFFIRPFLKIRLCISGSAPLSVTTLTNFKNNVRLPLLEGYGLSEASPVVSLNPPGNERAGSIGLPISGVSVKIVDDEMRELPCGEVGEIAVKGDNVMLGYYKKPEETAETIRNGWLRTGDLGKMDSEGFIYVVDRKKNMILVQGMNVYPREIEEVLLSHPAVDETAVIGIEDKKHGEIPIAFVVLKPFKIVSQKDLNTFCRDRLAAYKCPRKIIFLEKLPRSPVGKILKTELIGALYTGRES